MEDDGGRHRGQRPSPGARAVQHATRSMWLVASWVRVRLCRVRLIMMRVHGPDCEVVTATGDLAKVEAIGARSLEMLLGGGITWKGSLRE
eukprot:713250-Prymnesium_polylepis.1